MRFCLAPLAAAAAAVAFCPTVRAQTLDAPVELLPVIVTASPTPRSADETIPKVDVVTRAQIAQTAARDLGDVLSLVAGLDIARSGGPGQIASVFVRGGESDHTLLLIDGVRVTQTQGTGALVNISADMIERVEVVKGPRATLYGSDAVAAVINVITRKGDGVGTRASLRGGRFNSIAAHVSHSVGDGDNGLVLSVGRDFTSGMPTLRSSTTNAGQDLQTVSLRGDALVRPGLGLGISAWRSEADGEYHNFAGIRRQRAVTQTLAATVDWEQSAAWSSRAQASYSSDENQQVETPDAFRTQRPQLTLSTRYAQGSHAMNLGGYVAQDRTRLVGTDFFSGAPFVVTDSRDTRAASAVYEYRSAKVQGTLGAALTKADGFSAEPTWNAELGAAVWQGGRVLASAGTAFRAPGPVDRFYPGYGTPDLDPERGRSYELGLAQQWGKHQQFDLRLFRNEVRDLINFDLSTFAAGNVDEARTQGVELAWQGRWDGLSLQLAGIAQDPKNCSADGEGTPVQSCDDGGQLARRSKLSLTGSAAYNAARWGVGADWSARDSRPDFDAETFARVDNGGVGLLNLWARYALRPQLSLTARVDNATDRQYQSVSGYRAPGAAGYVTLRYQSTP